MANFEDVSNLFEYQKQIREDRRMRDYVPDEPKKPKKKYSIAEIGIMIIVGLLLLFILFGVVLVGYFEKNQNKTSSVPSVTYKNSKSGLIITNRSGVVGNG